MATLTGQKINTTYDGLLKTEDNQPISTTKKRVTDGYGNQTGLSVDSLGNVDVSDDLNVLGNAVVTGSTTANSFIKTGGTSTQFLKADGSIDGNTYLTSSTDTLDSVTDRGNSTTNSITVNGLTATTATVDSLEIQFGLRDQANSLGTNGQVLTSTGTGTDWKSTSELGLIDGSGTSNRLPKFTDADTIGNSTITDTGTKIGVNNANPTYSLDVYRNEATNILRLQNNTFSSWFGSDASGFAIETNLFKPIVFKPSGVTAMTLDSSGNVTLNNNLSIGGTLIDSNSSSGTSGQILSSTGTGTDWVSLSEISGVDGSGTANYIAKWTDGDTIGNSVIYDNGTNVGIGISDTSGVKLYVQDSVGIVARFLRTGSYGDILEIGRQGISIGASIGYPTDNTMSFNTNATERMRIDSSGNVGIGTTPQTSQTRALHIGSSTGGAEVHITSTTGSAASDGLSLIHSGNDSYFFNRENGTMQFGTNNTERMRITSAGNVGIGTSSPSSILHIKTPLSSASSEEIALRVESTPSGGNPDRQIELVVKNDGNAANTYGILRLGDHFTNANTPSKVLISASGNSYLNGGNVGIGTSSPATPLQVESTGVAAFLKSSSNVVPVSIFNSGGTVSTLGFKGSTTANEYSVRIGADGNNLVSYTANTERLRILDNGNVGIGTSSPAQKLTLQNGTFQITGTSTFAGNVEIGRVGGDNNMAFATGGAERMRIDSSGLVSITRADSSAQLKLERTVTGTGSMYIGADSIGFKVFDNSFTPRLVVESTGNVGIGTSSPAVPLNIQASNAAMASNGIMLIQANSAATNNGGQISFGTTSSRHAAIAGRQESTGGSAGYLQLGTRASTGDITERMRITSGGDVLVGITNTASEPTNNNFTIINSASNASITIGGHGGTHTAVKFRHNGATTPGTIVITTNTTTYNTSSDYRLKEDWQPMANALDRIEALKPINFAWKSDGTRVDGFLAHELAEVIPEAVTGEKDATEEYEIPAVLDEEGNVIEEATTGVRGVYQGIDQSKIVPLLVAAIQELKAEIELLKTK